MLQYKVVTCDVNIVPACRLGVHVLLKFFNNYVFSFVLFDLQTPHGAWLQPKTKAIGLNYEECTFLNTADKPAPSAYQEN